MNMIAVRYNLNFNVESELQHGPCIPNIYEVVSLLEVAEGEGMRRVCTWSQSNDLYGIPATFLKIRRISETDK
jgi:hypothetical protein